MLKKNLLCIIFIYCTAFLFGQTTNISQSISDYDFSVGTKSAISTEISYYDVEHGRIFDHTDNPRENYSEIYFHENGLAEKIIQKSGSGNEYIYNYEYDSNWNCVQNPYYQASYDSENRLIELKIGSYKKLVYIYHNKNLLEIQTILRDDELFSTESIYSYHNKRILSQTVDFNGKLDKYDTSEYDDEGNLIHFTKFYRANINMVDKFHKSVERIYYYTDGNLSKYILEADAAVGYLKTITFYTKNSKKEKIEEYRYQNNQFELKKITLFKYENSRIIEEEYDGSNNLKRIVVSDFENEKKISETIYSSDDEVDEIYHWKYDQTGNVIEMTREKIYNGEMVLISRLIGDYEYY